jgi:8-oxo-dGTP pyrophosphatase MutT (NUDIX family)
VTALRQPALEGIREGAAEIGPEGYAHAGSQRGILVTHNDSGAPVSSRPRPEERRPRPAASVILARPASGGVEVFMLRRSSRSSFVPHAFVFPGGTLDPDDAGERVRARTLGLDPARLRTLFRASIPPELPADALPVDDALAPALLIAALRELFEEAGVALARTASGDALGPAEHERLAGARARLHSGDRAFAAMLEEHDWYADAAALHYFSHWITPPPEPRRYDTHFFLAIAPDQQALADADETHDGIWISPPEALERHRRGDFYLVYPTIKHLERIAPFGDVEALAAFARSKPVLTIMPAGSRFEEFGIPASLEDAW